MRNELWRRGRRRPRARGGCCGCFSGCITALCGLVALVALVCGGGVYLLMKNAPTPPRANFTPSQFLADNLDHKISTASAAASQTRSFSLSLTDSEVASWLDLNATSMKNSRLPLENVQVTFQNGQGTLYGEINVLGLAKIGARTDFRLHLDAAGQVQVEITSARFGSLNLPQSYRTAISDAVKNAVDEELRTIKGSYHLTFLSLTDGRLNIQGTVF